MSRKGSYLGGHTILAVKKKNKSKVSTSSIIKAKKNWPYKTIKPDEKFTDLTPDNRLIIKNLRIYLAINKRRIIKNLDKKNKDSSLLKKLLNEKVNIEKLIKTQLRKI